jgi:pimeloyl-ACP methyl ester carboxylesterase
VNVYFISGLGADRAVFRHIILPQGFTAHHLDWIKPQPDESLQHYALRLAEGIDRSQPFILLGLSMGGMMAVEIAKTYPAQSVILLSSIPVAQDLPKYYHWVGGLRRIIPIGFFMKASVVKRFFTTETAEDKRMLKAMIRRVDPAFVKWAMGAILKWDCKDAPRNIVHIHGTADGILPCRFTHPHYKLRGAGHLAVLNRAKEINSILAEVLLPFSFREAQVLQT